MSDYQSKPGTPYGFIPCKLFVKDRPELLVFPLKIMFMSWWNIDGVDTSGTSLYEPDISSYTNGDNVQSMCYYNKYCDDDYIDIKYFPSGGRYEGEKHIKYKSVVTAFGPNWKAFFVHLTMTGLSKDEDCKFDKPGSENGASFENGIKQFLWIVTRGQEMKIARSYTTDELLDAIDSLSDDEVVSLSMPRPGHPEQRGFIWNQNILKDQLPEVAHALMKRLR